MTGILVWLVVRAYYDRGGTMGPLAATNVPARGDAGDSRPAAAGANHAGSGGVERTLVDDMVTSGRHLYGTRSRWGPPPSWGVTGRLAAAVQPVAPTVSADCPSVA